MLNLLSERLSPSIYARPSCLTSPPKAQFQAIVLILAPTDLASNACVFSLEYSLRKTFDPVATLNGFDTALIPSHPLRSHLISANGKEFAQPTNPASYLNVSWRFHGEAFAWSNP